MFRIIFFLLAMVGFLAACEQAPVVDSDGKVHRIFRIKERDTAELQFRHLDTVNAVRQNNGLGPIQLSAELNAAAKTHAIDMSRQNRPWHFGSDGSSPLDRLARSGYAGPFISENISETFEDDLTTLQAWLDEPETRAAILSPDARAIGFAWHQERNGKIWWVQVIGG